MNTAFDSSLSFGSRVRSKLIGNNKYTGRRTNFHSKPTQIHWATHIPELKISYSRKHFILLPQAVSTIHINHLLQKFSCSSVIIDLVMNGFTNNEVRSDHHVWDKSIITFVKEIICLEFPNAFNVKSLERLSKSVVE